ncbi:transmembrane protein 106A-like [Antennarius striatus]|uniref:transmembrane protein 106A-like n=1 Tax=Antennarius striatus TaxID=241820 RepID=UPI0035B0F21B
MGAVVGKYIGEGWQRSRGDDNQAIIEKDDRERGFMGRRGAADTVDCPTCRGAGVIPRDQQSQLVSVIPCTDQRLKPRHTKRYVFMSVGICLLVVFLVLFFLFPRYVLLSPFTIKSSLVYFRNSSIQIHIMHDLNITNHNYVAVQAYNLSVQAVIFDLVVGTVTIRNVTSVKPLSNATVSFLLPIKLTDIAIMNYCEKSTLPVHILYLHLQTSMTVYYLTHYEQLSLETSEFINCGANSTVPRVVQPS